MEHKRRSGTESARADSSSPIRLDSLVSVCAERALLDGALSRPPWRTDRDPRGALRLHSGAHVQAPRLERVSGGARMTPRFARVPKGGTAVRHGSPCERCGAARSNARWFSLTWSVFGWSERVTVLKLKGVYSGSDARERERRSVSC